MLSYSELKRHIATLTEQAALACATELQPVAADLRAKIAEYNLTVTDIFGCRRGRLSEKSKTALPPKYCDQKTGVTWSGRGRPAGWLDHEQKPRPVSNQELSTSFAIHNLFAIRRADEEGVARFCEINLEVVLIGPSKSVSMRATEKPHTHGHIVHSEFSGV